MLIVSGNLQKGGRRGGGGGELEGKRLFSKLQNKRGTCRDKSGQIMSQSSMKLAGGKTFK